MVGVITAVQRYRVLRAVVRYGRAVAVDASRRARYLPVDGTVALAAFMSVVDELDAVTEPAGCTP